MKQITRLLNWLRDSGNDLSTRGYCVTSLTTAVTLFAIFIWDIFIGESTLKLTVLGVGIVSMLTIVILSIRFRWVQPGAILVSLAIIFVVLPLEYFTGGGVYGCTPIWFAYAFLYVGLNVVGRMKYVLLPALPLSAIVCYVTSYYHPELLTEHDMKTAYLDSIASLIGVGVTTLVTITFLMRLYDRERRLAAEQKQEITELNQAQSRFFSSMSHEIRTPINTIIGLNEMILREDVSDEVAENAANIRSAGRMLLHLVNDILDMSKIESGEMEIVPVEYDVGDMLSDIVGMVWLSAREKGLEFHVDVDPALPARLIGDEVRIRQIVINVLNNAIKYTREGSVNCSIQFARGEDKRIRVIYTVSDTGQGIKKENIPYLFTAFKRVDVEKNRYIEGTGLGLSIVKEFVDLMGGSVKVNSVWMQGSTFVIELPQEVGSEQQIGEINMESRHAMNHRSNYRRSFEAPRARILAVDDNTANLMVVTKLLRDTLVRIDTAQSGAEALQMTLTTHYDLIFMDHMMPEMDGIECLHAIRSQAGGVCRDTRVIALTANAGSGNQELYARESFDGYLVKPVNSEELEETVMRMLPQDLIERTEEIEALKNPTINSIEAHHRKRLPVMITTDSVCDLPDRMFTNNNVQILPYHVRTGDGLFLDGIEMDQRGLIAYLTDKETNSAVSEEPTISEYEAFFGGCLAKANNIIHISMSSKVSNGFGTATEAAKTFNNVTVIDSGHLSAGLGFMVLEAARLAAEGQAPEKIISMLRTVKTKIHSGFIVDDVIWLARAGRINELVSRIAGAFLLRPVLMLRRDGRMTVGRICFGTRERSWRTYIRTTFKKTVGRIDRRLLFVVHVGLNEEEMKWIEHEIGEHMRFDNVIFQKASPAISINSGPGTFGLLFKTI
ncbi:MAG: DegV family EDD domain-containing protein [Lachnospiraceae bacterium]|nr:DegV family EDD domain-containing protein [Lachnospiraceae bacterium]